MGMLTWGALRLQVARSGTDWIVTSSEERSGLRCQFRRLKKRVKQDQG